MREVGELAITQGPTRCMDCQRGCCLLRAKDWPHAEWLHIDQADPLIRVTDVLLREMLLFGCGPHASLRPGPGAVPPGKPDMRVPGDLTRWFEQVAGHLEGWLLTVRGVNRTVVYRITGKVPDMLAWYAEWPD